MDKKELDLFRKRRTIRRFTDEDISVETLKALLEAASVAPSRLDRRPLHYLVIRDKALKAKLAEALRVRPYIEQAPVVIAVCADKSISPTWELDGSAAIENMLLAATSIGLGTAWVGSKGSTLWDQAVAVLHTDAALPDTVDVVSLVAIGHPAEEKRAYDLGEKLDATRIHCDHWDNLEWYQAEHKARG
jgi:nitroreductase